jgi:glutamate N-acetyltransferase/amino-acid N-acetyltransferase
VLTLQGRRVFAHGQPVTFDAAAASKALARPHVDVDLDCRMGNAQAVCWTCDLSKDYVTINAE